MKRIAAINDMSGIGKCSLTAAIPVISASGIECNPVPTAILSSHTGGLDGYTFRDLTEDIKEYSDHWKRLGIIPDTIYSGYLASEKQVDLVIEIINKLGNEHTKVIVDPAMADSGRLYSGFNKEFPSEMSKLCRMADIIIPNVTEACLLTGNEYKESVEEEYYLKLLSDLSDYVKNTVILTGVHSSDDNIGCAVYDKKNYRTELYYSRKFPGTYYGTGDLFASVIAAGVTNGHDCFESAVIATEFLSKSIEKTFNEKTDTRLGVHFEYYLGYVAEKLGAEI